MTWPSLTAPVPALPLDLLRIMVGLLAAAYFARTWREAPLFSGPRGLLDHDLVRRVLPFTRLSLFPPGASIRTLRAMFAVGCMASLLLAAGIMPQASALVAYVIAVSTYRWNLPLMYVDDAIVHLALFWMVLLPVGTTLTMPDVVADPATAWAGARIETVPGFTVRCFLANLALVYLVAGLWKWSSPLWRRGWALYAVLRMAASYAPDWWRPRPAAPMRVANWFALAIEAPLALLLVLPPGSPVKLALGAGAVAFHVGILVTMKFPFANLAMLGALVVFFGDEVTGVLGAPPPPGAVATATLAAADVLAAFTVACLALLFLLNAVWYRDGATVERGSEQANPRSQPALRPAVGHRPRAELPAVRLDRRAELPRRPPGFVTARAATPPSGGRRPEPTVPAIDARHPAAVVLVREPMGPREPGRTPGAAVADARRLCPRVRASAPGGR